MNIRVYSYKNIIRIGYKQLFVSRRKNQIYKYICIKMFMLGFKFDVGC